MEYKPEALLHELLNIAEGMLANGAEINRVEDTIMRLGKAYGAVRMNVFVITSSIVVTMVFPDGGEVTQTRRILKPASTDFVKLENLNALSRECCLQPLSVEELARKIRELNEKNPKLWLLCAGSMLAGGGFAVFFGGSIWDGVIAALFAVLIWILQIKMSPICPNRVIFNLLCSMITGFGICLTAKLFPELHGDKIMIGDIMLLIPGIAMTNSVKDVLVGDTISGVMRFIETLLWAGGLACGFMISIWLIGG